MSHAQDTKKDLKKQPTKTLKEKRLEKQAKRASKYGGASPIAI
jgi:hypothetical protein